MSREMRTEDLEKLYRMAYAAAERCEDKRRDFVVPQRSQSSEFGFTLIATHFPGPGLTRFTGSVKVTAENCLYNLYYAAPLRTRYSIVDVNEFLKNRSQ